MEPQSTDIYTLAGAKANEIEAELKRLQRWDSKPLPGESFENMGAFGCNTMTFVQWLQFVLLPRIREIINERGEFPAGSMLAPYAIREFDGDPNAGNLHELLYELDELANGPEENADDSEETVDETVGVDTISFGDTTIPPVVFTLIDLLPQFEGGDLESQLQTFDAFLAVLSPAVRPVISESLQRAAGLTSNPASKERIEKAAASIAAGGRTAEPYDHEAAMKKYTEEQKKSFPYS